jgi:hypothetical protein
MRYRYEHRCGIWANDRGDDNIDMVILDIDMGYLVTLLLCKRAALSDGRAHGDARGERRRH